MIAPIFFFFYNIIVSYFIYIIIFVTYWKHVKEDDTKP